MPGQCRHGDQKRGGNRWHDPSYHRFTLDPIPRRRSRTVSLPGLKASPGPVKLAQIGLRVYSHGVKAESLLVAEIDVFIVVDRRVDKLICSCVAGSNMCCTGV